MWMRAGEAQLCSPTNSSKISGSGTHRRDVTFSKVQHDLNISVLFVFDYRQCFNMKISSMCFSKHVSITTNIDNIATKGIMYIYV